MDGETIRGIMAFVVAMARPESASPADRNAAMVELLESLPQPSHWLVVGAEPPATIYMLSQDGFLTAITADLDCEGSDENPPTLTVERVLVSPVEHRVALRVIRLAGVTRRQWTFDVGLDAPIVLYADLPGVVEDRQRIVAFAESLAENLGWPSAQPVG